MAEDLTLQQQRQAIREGVTASRGTGAQMQQQRRAIGSAMIERRTGKQVVADVNSLNKADPRQKTLPETAPVGGLPPAIGVGPWRGTSTTSPGGGTSGPFTEPDYTAREWWPGGIPSNDGLLMLPAEKKVVMTDGTGAQVVFNYAEPAL